MARIVVPGCPHHVMQRGNPGSDVFQEEEDRILYKTLLEQFARQFGVEIWAFCFMKNHMHLIAVPLTAESLGLAIGRTNQRFSAAISARTGLPSHLWPSRYFSSALDHKHLWIAVKYVEQNPVRERIVRHPEKYRWSSAGCHCGLVDEPLLSPARPFPGPVADWSVFIRNRLSPKEELAIRTATHTGRPHGSPGFIALIEEHTGRTLAPQKRGRKPKHLAAIQHKESDDPFG